MVHVPAGSFLMGSLPDSSGLPGLDRDPQPESDEFPQRTVSLSEFWIDRTEVTNVRYRECVNAGVCASQSGGDPNYHNNPAFDNYPVVLVSWDDAKIYCQWVGKRLPTEAEWEKAARGTDGRIWPWGNALKDNLSAPVERANVGDGAATGITETGAYPTGASPYGALDMTGNVWEWVNDWYSPVYYGGRPESDTSPPGPSKNESTGQKVIRGGSFGTLGVDARTAERNAVAPGPSFDIGFRCARSK
jgi:formylglycine-generating enzyme required for sulfatase activity